MKTGVYLSDIDFSAFKGQTVLDVVPVGRELANIKFSGGSLNIECSWRLRNTLSILVGQSERKDDTPTSILKNHLLNKGIISIYHYEPTDDLTVEFENELYLDLFADSSLFEKYQLYKEHSLFLIGK